ncbi:MAG: efflux RND transporter periplasmic adaptor subunit [Elusimicrobia bacterium]|nr:efflux RND transporter periplasmic adaptor subunit [Elusimicrobiota bacterium]
MRRGALAAGAAALAAAIGTAALLRTRAERAASSPGTAPAGIGCLGRLEPDGGVIRVSAPALDGQPPLVAKIAVREGDWVRAGQELALLRSAPELEAALRRSEAQEALARSELDNARSEHRRYAALHETKDVSSSELDGRRLALESAQARLQAAAADVAYQRAKREAGLVRAPRDGRVLKIHAKAGEAVDSQGVLELGDTTRMVVMAEVYETDAARVQVGAAADVDGGILPRRLEGTVEQVGAVISRGTTLSSDPAAFSDSRVVKVKIRLPESDALAKLVGGEVAVVIRP